MKTNHQRGFVEKMTRYVGPSRNGDSGPGTKCFDAKSVLADMSVGAVACTHHGGKHGIARDIRGAKKFVRSRIRFRENMRTRELMKEGI
jgi:hypothetical protein